MLAADQGPVNLIPDHLQNRPLHRPPLSPNRNSIRESETILLGNRSPIRCFASKNRFHFRRLEKWEAWPTDAHAHCRG